METERRGILVQYLQEAKPLQITEYRQVSISGFEDAEIKHR
jgi:hypothetical protein